MYQRPLSRDELDAEAVFMRPLLRRPPWHRDGDQEDTGVRALFRRYRPGTAPHALSPELRGAVWERASFFPDAIGDDEALRSRAVDHAAFMLHLLARGPANSAANGFDFGAACLMPRADRKKNRPLTDARFTRLMGTPRPQRLEALSRVMQRLEKASVPLCWAVNAEDKKRQSFSWNASLRSTDEVWPLLNFLFGYDPPDRSIARWAAGFFGTRGGADDVTDEPTAAADETA